VFKLYPILGNRDANCRAESRYLRPLSFGLELDLASVLAAKCQHVMRGVRVGRRLRKLCTSSLPESRTLKKGV